MKGKLNKWLVIAGYKDRKGNWNREELEFDIMIIASAVLVGLLSVLYFNKGDNMATIRSEQVAPKDHPIYKSGVTMTGTGMTKKKPEEKPKEKQPTEKP